MKDHFFHKKDRQEPSSQNPPSEEGGSKNFRRKKYYFNKNRKKPRPDGAPNNTGLQKEESPQESSGQAQGQKRNFQQQNQRNGFFPRKNYSERPGNSGNYDRKNTPAPSAPIQRKPKVVLGKCLLCQSNVSDDVYSLKTSSGQYLHFECMVKSVREKAKEAFPRVRDFRVYYTGNGTFSAVIEKIHKGNMRWEILFKTTLKELEQTLENQSNTDSNS